MQDQKTFISEALKLEILLESFSLFEKFITSIPTTGRNITKRSLSESFRSEVKDKVKITESFEQNRDRIVAGLEKKYQGH